MKNRKARGFLYSLIAICIGLYLIFFIDSVRFHNLRKIGFSCRKKVDIASFDDIIDIVSIDNLTEGKLKMIQGLPYLMVQGFDSIYLGP